MSDRRSPVFQSASTNADGTKVILTYDEALGVKTARERDFKVNVDGARRVDSAGVRVTVDSAVVNGNTLELTLSNAVEMGQAVTVRYVAPRASDLTTNAAVQDASGNDAARLSTTAVTNVSTFEVDRAAPVFQSAATSADGTKVVLSYDEALGLTTARARDFTVKVDGAKVVVRSAVVNGDTLELTLANAVGAGQAVTVKYNAPRASDLTTNAAVQDASGNDAARLSTTTVTNISTADRAAPVFQSAATSADGTKVVLTYDEALGLTTARARDFTVKVDGAKVAVHSAVVNGDTLELTLSNAVETGQAVTVAYRARQTSDLTTNAAVQDASGNDAARLSTTAVTNVSTFEVDRAAPVFQSAATNSDGTKVILTYDEALGLTTPRVRDFTVKVDGATVAVDSAVVNGDTLELTLSNAVGAGEAVTVAYSAPRASDLTTNAAVQDASGNDAARLSTTAVTNVVNTPAVIGGDTSGSVTEDSAATLTAGGSLTVTDPDPGEAVFVAQTDTAGSNGYGSFTLGTDGSWSYSADNSLAAIQALNDGDTLTDGFTAVTADGTTQVVTVTITGVDETPAVIGGDTSGSVTEDSSATLTAVGMLTVTDPDPGEAEFVSQTDTAGSNGYGSFTLGTDGSWSYSADNSLAAIQALNDGDTLTDSFTAVTADGTTQVVTVTITGVDDVSAGIIELSEVEAGTGGFMIRGSGEYWNLGRSVRSAGDVNGDGFDDVIVGGVNLPNANRDGIGPGATFVVFGKSDGTVVDLSAVEAGTGGFVIIGASDGDNAGASVSSAGDVNGDGLDDLIVGATGHDPNGTDSGASFVVFGKGDGTAVQLSAVEAGTGGFAINGVLAGDGLGASVSSAGDVNGDGLDDLIVLEEPFRMVVDPDWGFEFREMIEGPASSFVVFGKGDGTAVELSDVRAGAGGFVINGVMASWGDGRRVSSAGDVNGDGLDDVIVGVEADSPNGYSSGSSYVVFGKGDGTAVELSDITKGDGGFVINGAYQADGAGFSVSSAGDVNGDGLDDLIVGAWGAFGNGYSGASYVVFGKSDGSAVELSDVEAGTGGFVINGASMGDRAGHSVSSAGDVNGDGLDDLIVGAPGADPNGAYSGASYVVFGKDNGSPVDLSAVWAGNWGLVINGTGFHDDSGKSVSSAGDVNGDGFDDLIVGTPTKGVFDPVSGEFNPNSPYVGGSYVVFGGNFTGSVTDIGTTGSDTLTGTTADDVIFAGIGDDTLDGGGGTDRLSGGAGADVFTLRNLDGTTTVIDFDGEEGDRLDVSDFGLADFTSFEALLSADGPGGHDTRISFDADTFVIVHDIRLDDLVASHVVL